MFRSSSTIFCVYVLNGDTIECDKPKINCKQIENISNVYNDRSISV